MQRCKHGDTAAFAVVVEALQTRLFSFLRRLTRNQERAEELVQETFLRMFRARARFIDGARVDAWAFSLARNLYIDSYRHDQCGIGPDLSPDPETVARVEAGPCARPDAVHEGNQVLELIIATLQRIPESQRVAYTLVYEDGFSLREAAEILGTTEMAVRMRLDRARRALRNALGLTDDDRETT